MKTAIEDDPALQFDIEEDLDILDLKQEINNNETKQLSEVKVISRMYENTIKEKDAASSLWPVPFPAFFPLPPSYPVC